MRTDQRRLPCILRNAHKIYVPEKVEEENMKGMSWFDMDLKNVQFEIKYNKKKNAM